MLLCKGKFYIYSRKNDLILSDAASKQPNDISHLRVDSNRATDPISMYNLFFEFEIHSKWPRSSKFIEELVNLATTNR